MVPEGDDRNEDEAICPGCGLPQSDWSLAQAEGFVAKSGERYCCQACAEGKACGCQAPLKQALP